MKYKTTGAPEPSFQIAPMIDVVFLLLIFFIVTNQFKQDELDIKTKVPTSEVGKEEKRASYREIIINIRKSGEVVVNRQVLTPAQLLIKLKRITETDRNQPVRLRGDAECNWQDVTKIIDICIKAGIWNYSFATKGNAS